MVIVTESRRDSRAPGWGRSVAEARLHRPDCGADDLCGPDLAWESERVGSAALRKRSVLGRGLQSFDRLSHPLAVDERC